jgi:hypothetical protein
MRRFDFERHPRYQGSSPDFQGERPMKKLFNWLAEKPSRQYTLCESHSIKFNRAARFVERINTIPGIAIGIGIAAFGFPIAVAGAPVGAAGAIALGAAFAVAAKASGLVKGAIVHFAAKGLSALADHLSRPKVAPQPG